MNHSESRRRENGPLLPLTPITSSPYFPILHTRLFVLTLNGYQRSGDVGLGKGVLEWSVYLGFHASFSYIKTPSLPLELISSKGGEGGGRGSRDKKQTRTGK